MAKSIIQQEKACLICDSTQNVECHHVFFGANRKVSDKHGFTVWLCNYHHTGSKNSVHQNREMDLCLKKMMQLVYEIDHTREEFVALIGRNYL